MSALYPIVGGIFFGMFRNYFFAKSIEDLFFQNPHPSLPPEGKECNVSIFQNVLNLSPTGGN
jgi:hypothetical protein